MPVVRVQTSVAISTPKLTPLLGKLSQATAETLAKPERYVMVLLEQEVPMLLGRDPAPAALVEVRSVGQITAEQARQLTRRFEEILGAAIGVAGDRVFSTYAGVEGALWGHDGGTFG